jgi:ketosteroid isomerase-like protein
MREAGQMPTNETLERFIRRVESGAHAEACEEFYTEQSSMQENQATPRVGRVAHVANERRVLARARSVESKCIRPVFVHGDRVVIRWFFRFHWLDGSVTEMDELAYQRWEGERIAEETFFYDPAQRTPRKPPQG